MPGMELALSGTELAAGDPLDELIEAAHTLEIPNLELWYPKNIEAEGLEETLTRLDREGLRVICVSTGSELYREV